MIYYRTVSRGIGPAKFSTHRPESGGENVQADRIRKWEEGDSRTHTHEWERARRGKSVQGAAAAVVVIRVAGIEEIQAQEAGRDHFASVSRVGGKAKVLLCFFYWFNFSRSMSSGVI